MGAQDRTDRYDAVVVGAGPAGCAAAFRLAAGGLKTCLIDKAIFPRQKLCGGLVTARSRAIFERTFGRAWDAALFSRPEEIAFFSAGRMLGRPHRRPDFHLAMRFDFDHYLLGLAVGAGVEPRLGRRVETLDPERRSIVLDDGSRVAYGALVAADGVNSQIARRIFGRSFDNATIGFALETEAPLAALPEQGGRLEIDFAAADWGYGWVFPKPGSITIGVCGRQADNPDLRAKMNSYLESRGVDPQSVRIKGQFLPFGDCRADPVHAAGAILFAGDAAGAVDPITGEGIAYAMETGAAAGDAILRAKAEGVSPVDLYRVDYARITRGIRQASRWRLLIYPRGVRRLFAWAFADAGTLRQGYLDILSGAKEYSDLPALFGAQAKRALAKVGRRIAAPLRSLTRG